VTLTEAEIASLVDRSASLAADHLPLSMDRIRAYNRTQVAAQVASAADAWVMDDDGTTTGLALIHSLPWDTEQLGVPSSRMTLLLAKGDDRTRNMDLARTLAGVAVDRLRERGDRHVSIRLDARELPAVQAVEALGFRMVDGIQRFVFDLAGAQVPTWDEAAVPVRDAVEADIPALRELSANGFVYDRFHNDPVIPSETADRLYGVWIENAILGKTGCAVLVAECDGEPAGFFLLGEDTSAPELLGEGVGTLVLITVSGRFRRRGVARTLSWASLRRLGERGNRFCEVGTQIANRPATAVYLDAGFRLAGTQLSLRWWGGDAA